MVTKHRGGTAVGDDLLIGCEVSRHRKRQIKRWGGVEIEISSSLPGSRCRSVLQPLRYLLARRRGHLPPFRSTLCPAHVHGLARNEGKAGNVTSPELRRQSKVLGMKTPHSSHVHPFHRVEPEAPNPSAWVLISSPRRARATRANCVWSWSSPSRRPSP